ncbi:RHS repeat-associated core domain-containing protein [Paenibacillus sp. LHD-117]|uniref:RHS repeat-associated core domain-containing protein n=1 Tax=Paenibacillus sp. LHD-117 TaxID=3071412 RepID=UPI0027E123E1|nr:RHS repeat-associated core domain-containing protein [Paenibacillus sp. LHD-117]MDQ6418733.1 RHS repeat-associated core domain-containing protein [Paenibacillus sp. LHD-117]
MMACCWYDNETGLYYLMARYYDSGIGRFITRDIFPGFIEDPLSLNKYVYTENNPVMNVDPSGLLTIPRKWLATAIDALSIASPLGAAYAPIQFLFKAAAKSIVKKLAPQIARLAGKLSKWALGTAGFATNYALNFTTNTILNLIYNNLSSFLSLGGGIALFLDMRDGQTDGKIKF